MVVPRRRILLSLEYPSPRVGYESKVEVMEDYPGQRFTSVSPPFPKLYTVDFPCVKSGVGPTYTDRDTSSFWVPKTIRSTVED